MNFNEYDNIIYNNYKIINNISKAHSDKFNNNNDHSGSISITGIKDNSLNNSKSKKNLTSNFKINNLFSNINNKKNSHNTNNNKEVYSNNIYSKSKYKSFLNKFKFSLHSSKNLASNNNILVKNIKSSFNYNPKNNNNNNDNNNILDNPTTTKSINNSKRQSKNIDYISKSIEIEQNNISMLNLSKGSNYIHNESHKIIKRSLFNNNNGNNLEDLENIHKRNLIFNEQNKSNENCLYSIEDSDIINVKKKFKKLPKKHNEISCIVNISNTENNTVHTIINTKRKNSNNLRFYKTLKNIEDSLSEEYDGNYYDYVPKWYSISPKSVLCKVLSTLNQIHIIIMLIYFPLELTIEKYSNLTIGFHIYLEIYFTANFITQLFIGFYDKKLRKINYNFFCSFVYRYNKNSVLFSFIEIFYLFVNYISILIIKCILNISESEFKNAFDILVISKFFLLIYLMDWINMNSLLEFSNNLALYLGNRSSNIDKYKKNNKKNNLLNNWQFIFNLVAFVKIFCFYLMIIHIFSCLWIYIYIKDKEIYSNNNWVYRYDLLEKSINYKYILSFYFSLTTLLSVGYGDVIPSTINERILVSVYMILCAFFYSFLVTLISFLFSKKETKLALLQEKENILNSIHRDINLKEDLYKKIYKAIEHYSLDYKTDKMELINSLPRKVKLEVQSYIFDKIVNKITYFDNIENNSFIFELCSLLKSQLYEKNIVLIQENNLIEEMHFVLKGKLYILLSDEMGNYPISKISVGQSFGDHLLDSNLRFSPYTIKTKSEINDVLILSKDNFKFIKNKYKKEIEICLLNTSFMYNLINELTLGAKIYFELNGSLKNYKEFSMKLINYQINKDIDKSMPYKRPNDFNKTSISTLFENNYSSNEENEKKLVKFSNNNLLVKKDNNGNFMSSIERNKYGSKSNIVFKKNHFSNIIDFRKVSSNNYDSKKKSEKFNKRLSKFNANKLFRGSVPDIKKKFIDKVNKLKSFKAFLKNIEKNNLILKKNIKYTGEFFYSKIKKKFFEIKESSNKYKLELLKKNFINTINNKKISDKKISNILNKNHKKNKTEFKFKSNNYVEDNVFMYYFYNIDNTLSTSNFNACTNNNNNKKKDFKFNKTGYIGKNKSLLKYKHNKKNNNNDKTKNSFKQNNEDFENNKSTDSSLICDTYNRSNFLKQKINCYNNKFLNKINKNLFSKILNKYKDKHTKIEKNLNIYAQNANNKIHNNNNNINDNNKYQNDKKVEIINFKDSDNLIDYKQHSYISNNNVINNLNNKVIYNTIDYNKVLSNKNIHDICNIKEVNNSMFEITSSNFTIESTKKSKLICSTSRKFNKKIKYINNKYYNNKDIIDTSYNLKKKDNNSKIDNHNINQNNKKHNNNKIYYNSTELKNKNKSNITKSEHKKNYLTRNKNIFISNFHLNLKKNLLYIECFKKSNKLLDYISELKRLNTLNSSFNTDNNTYKSNTNNNIYNSNNKNNYISNILNLNTINKPNIQTKVNCNSNDNNLNTLTVRFVSDNSG